MLLPVGSLPVPNLGHSTEGQGAVQNNEERATGALFPASSGRRHDGPVRQFEARWRHLPPKGSLPEANSPWAPEITGSRRCVFSSGDILLVFPNLP